MKLIRFVRGLVCRNGAEGTLYGPEILALVIVALSGIGFVLSFAAYNGLVQVTNDIDKTWAISTVKVKLT